MRRVRIAWVSAYALMSLGLIAACDRPPPPPSLFVLISVDTLRADFLGAYGSVRGLTPRMDRLARESLVFTSAYSATSFTLPSLSALLTGRYPEELGIWNNESAVPESVPTLATELRASGWRTGAVVSNFILRSSSGIDTGFDVYDDRFPQREAVRNWPERTATDTTDAFFRILDDCRVGPSRCFVWVHYQDPHGPYTPPPGTRESHIEAERRAPDGRRQLPVQAKGDIGLGGIPRYQYLEGNREVAFYRAGYDAEVNYVDTEVGRLLDGLRERRLADEALVVFTADHGEALGEHDYWFAHGEHLTDPLVRIPLMIRGPGIRPDRREDIVAPVDLFPTVLAWLDPQSKRASGRGRNLLEPDAAASDSVVYLATLGAGPVRRFAIVEGDFKFIASLNDGAWDGQLFRRGSESTNLVGLTGGVAASFRQRLSEFRAGLAVHPEIRQKFSPEELEQLRALGYVDVPRGDEVDAGSDSPGD